MAIESKKITYTDGVEALINLINVDRSTAQRFIAERRMVAKNLIKLKP